MVAAAGGMLQAAELGMTIIIDGFIMTNCILAASKLHPEVLEYCVFGHQGDEAGHKSVLEALHAKPLLNLGLRLGEGSHLRLSDYRIRHPYDQRNEQFQTGSRYEIFLRYPYEISVCGNHIIYPASVMANRPGR